MELYLYLSKLIEIRLKPVPKLITKNKVSYQTLNTVYGTFLTYRKTKFF